jgi:predicted enzyme related to lactoylglutathione lyase
MDSVVHFEIPMDDAARAKKFYADSFGWQLQDVPEMSYVMATTVEKGSDMKSGGMPAINGGMMKRGMVTAPSFAINVADIDMATQKVKAAGGVIMKEKTPVGTMGFMVYFKDTEGNILSLWQNAPKA